MRRWNIDAVVLYSHHGRRRRLDLDVCRVNIVVGPSHTGKSAIAEVIDYCLGAGECHLPGIVRSATSWVALRWVQGEEAVVIGRRVPGADKQTSIDMFWRRGSIAQDVLPESSSDIVGVMSKDVVLRLFERVVGIGDIVGETLNSERQGSRISARQLVPYMLQDDDIVTSKSTLLRGAQDQRRQHIVDALPYFLRVVDEATALKEDELRDLRAEVQAAERKIALAEGEDRRGYDTAVSLAREAVSRGLIPSLPAASGFAVVIETLEKASQWRPDSRIEPEQSEILRLEASEADVREVIRELRRKIRSAEEMLLAAREFEATVVAQQSKLSHFSLFRSLVDESTCPVCGAEPRDASPTISEIREASFRLTRELRSISVDRPQIDDYLREQKRRLHDEKERLRSIQAQLARLSEQTDLFEQAKNDMQRNVERGITAGRILYFLETTKPADLTLLKEKLPDLQRRMDVLMAQVDIDSKRELLVERQQLIAAYATEILKDLPLAQLYRGMNVYFSARTLECGLITAGRKKPMRDLGSEENYLSLHVAMMLAFHRYFREQNSPVPSVLVFDQLSRPYFPPEQQPDEVSVSDTETSALKQYFDVLFREVARQPGLQIIVLEHAFFGTDDRYLAATKHRWKRDGEKLVPEDWPTI